MTSWTVQRRLAGTMARMTLAIGDKAPDFTLKDQHGQDITLSSYAGARRC